MKTISEHRADKVLDTVMKFQEGTMSRREWLHMAYREGWKAERSQVRNYVKEEKLEEWLHYNRADYSGNPNWPPTKAYLEKKATLKAGIFDTVYKIWPNEKTVYHITKTEFDYFQSLLVPSLKHWRYTKSAQAEKCDTCGQPLPDDRTNHGIEGELTTCSKCFEDAQPEAFDDSEAVRMADEL